MLGGGAIAGACCSISCLRVPDPALKALHREERRRRARGETGCTRLRRGRRHRDWRTRGRAAATAREAGAAGVSIAGPAHDPYIPPAPDGHHFEPAARVRIAGHRHVLCGNLRRRRARGLSCNQCGPFSGAALGTALSTSCRIGRVFAALGLGLALPFLAVAFVPALRRKLPRPGPWMVRLQRILAIPMALTALGCLWLLWRLSGVTALQIGLGATVAVTLVLFGAGLIQRKGGQTGYVATLAAVAVAAIAVSALPQHPAAVSRAVAGAEPWSEEAVPADMRQGKPTFVFHCRLVPDLQGQRSCGDRQKRGAGRVQGCGRAGSRRRLDKRRSGNHALP